MKKKFLMLACVLLAMVPSFKVSAEEFDDSNGDDTSEAVYTTEYPNEPGRQPDIVSEAAIVIDANSGQVLYEKNAYLAEYPASITKIMTAYLALQSTNMDDVVTMSEDSIWNINRNSSHIALDVGEQISVKDCLYAMMVASANEAAYGLAEHVGGGNLDTFVGMMNQKAADLGCKNTHFANANGLYDPNHYSCAYDMAIITRAAIKLKDFRTLTSTLEYTIPPTNLQPEARTIYSKHKILRPTSKYYYEYAEGGKTGYITEAQNTLVTYAKKDDIELICVVLKCPGGGVVFTDTTALFDYCFNNYKSVTPLAGYSLSLNSDDNSIINNFNKNVNHEGLDFFVDTTFTMLIKNDVDPAAIVKETEFYENPTDSTIGVINLKYQDQLLGQVPIISQNDTSNAAPISIPEPTQEKKSFHINPIFIWIGVIVGFVLLLFSTYVIIINHKRRAYIKRRNRARKNNLKF